MTKLSFTAADFEYAVGRPLADFAGQCHAASLALVKSGALGKCRVARGTCSGVGSQHSWVVIGWNCYDVRATVVDPTLWSYDPSVAGVYVGAAGDRPHRPHGSGSIFDYGRPGPPVGRIIELDADLSPGARDFLDMVGPLDRAGWSVLAHAPVGFWPSGEILAAMYRHPDLAALIPIDIIGMATDLNPNGLYF